jgi:hypothetical protein
MSLLGSFGKDNKIIKPIQQYNKTHIKKFIEENKIDIIEFIEENKKILYNPDIPDYSPNYMINKYKENISLLPNDYSDIKNDNIKKIIEEKVNNYKNIIDKIIKNISYITFNDFIYTLKVVSYDIINFIKEKNIRDIVFMIPYKYEKSNFWIFLLSFKYFYNELPQHKLKVCMDYISDLDKYIEMGKNTIIIYPDDVIYSGKQIHQEFISPIQNMENIDVYKTVLIPYISQNSEKFLNLNSINNFYISDNIQKIKNTFLLNEQDILIDNYSFFNDKEYEILLSLKNCLDKFINSLFSIFNDKLWIYFQHKMADMVSINTYFLYTLPYIKYDKVFNINFLGAIGNDCDRNYIPQFYDNDYMPSNIPSCPKTLYKTLKYTYLGIDVMESYGRTANLKENNILYHIKPEFIFTINDNELNIFNGGKDLNNKKNIFVKFILGF